VFLPDRAAPRFLVWGAGAVASPLSAGGTPEKACLVDETLAPRKLAGVAVPLLDALPLLAAMTAAETDRAPASVAGWSLAAKLALDLVGRERLVPRVVAANGGTKAGFAVSLALPEDAERVVALARSAAADHHVERQRQVVRDDRLVQLRFSSGTRRSATRCTLRRSSSRSPASHQPCCTRQRSTLCGTSSRSGSWLPWCRPSRHPGRARSCRCRAWRSSR